MANLTARQLEMLRDFERDSEATDFDAYIPHTSMPSHLAWRNRERVIDALHRKGLLSPDGITDEGRAALVADAMHIALVVRAEWKRAKRWFLRLTLTVRF